MHSKNSWVISSAQFLDYLCWVKIIGYFFSDSNNFLGYGDNILTQFLGCLGFWVIFQRVTHDVGYRVLSLSLSLSLSLYLSLLTIMSFFLGGVYFMELLYYHVNIVYNMNNHTL